MEFEEESAAPADAGMDASVRGAANDPAPRMTRRNFLDVLGRTTLAGAAFSVTLTNVACGGGGGGGGSSRAFTGHYDGFLLGISGSQDAAAFVSFDALSDGTLEADININDPSRAKSGKSAAGAKTRSFPSGRATTTYDRGNGHFDFRTTLDDGSEVRLFGDLPNPGNPTRTTLFKLEYQGETYTGSIAFSGLYGYDDYFDDYGYDDYFSDLYEGTAEVRGGQAFVTVGWNGGKASGYLYIYDPTRAKEAKLIRAANGVTRKATYAAALEGNLNNNRQLNVTGVIGTGQTVRVTGTAPANQSLQFDFTLNYDGKDFTGTLYPTNGFYGYYDDYFDESE